MAADLPAQVNAAVADFEEMVAICLKNTLLMDRLEGTGVLSTEPAKDHGVLGYVARASGLDIDARRDHPFAAYQQLNFRVPVFTSGDVKARTYVGVDEVHESAKLIDQACRVLPSGLVRASHWSTNHSTSRIPATTCDWPRSLASLRLAQEATACWRGG